MIICCEVSRPGAELSATAEKTGKRRRCNPVRQARRQLPRIRQACVSPYLASGLRVGDPKDITLMRWRPPCPWTWPPDGRSAPSVWFGRRGWTFKKRPHTHCLRSRTENAGKADTYHSMDCRQSSRPLTVMSMTDYLGT